MAFLNFKLMKAFLDKRIKHEMWKEKIMFMLTG